MRKGSGNIKNSGVTNPVAEDAADGTPGFTNGDEIDEGADAATGVADASAAEEVISELQRDLTMERDKYLRLAAEFDNFRKRMLKERAEAETRGQAELVRQLLDPLDDIARFAHLDPATTECSTVVQGVDMVEKKLDKHLRTAGLEPLNPVDQPFDPSLHEAVATDAA